MGYDKQVLCRIRVLPDLKENQVLIMTSSLEQLTKVSTSYSSTIIPHNVSLPVASASDDDFELDSCQWSENSEDEDLDSLPSANWSRDIEMFDDQKSFHDDFSASSRAAANGGCEAGGNRKFLTSTPKKIDGMDETSRMSSMPTLQFYSQISKIKEIESVKACRDESVDSIVSWNFLRVMQTAGCAERCVTTVHELSELDVLSAHAQFDVKSPQEQNQWILEYFLSHCPCDADGIRDAKNITYIVAGRTVCLNIWLRILSISVSRYYRLRRDFLENGGGSSQVAKRSRSLSPKTMKAVAWMEHYFDRIGDKRPDKDGIYLPTCLTEKKIYDVMVEELYQGDESKSVCFSQFNKLYRAEFKNVTIPKVCNLCFIIVVCYREKLINVLPKLRLFSEANRQCNKIMGSLRG